MPEDFEGRLKNIEEAINQYIREFDLTVETVFHNGNKHYGIRINIPQHLKGA